MNIENKKTVEMYCLRCKKKVIVVPNLLKKETTKGIRYMYQSECPNCNTKMSKMTKKPSDINIISENINNENQNNIKNVVTNNDRYKEFEKNEPQKNNICSNFVNKFIKK